MDTAPAPTPASVPSTAVMPPNGPPLRVIAGFDDAPLASPLLGAWPRSAQIAAALLLLALVGLLAFHAGLYFGGRPTEHLPAPPEPIDINQASLAELQLLPGIGKTLAERIDEHRRKKGPFPTIDDLRQVPGIGPTILERIRVLITVEPSAVNHALLPKVQASLPIAGKASPVVPKLTDKELALQGVVIDVNSAPASELQRLPRIGPVISQRIIEEREKKSFQSIEDLDRVKGIGLKILETLRPYVTVGPSAGKDE